MSDQKRESLNDGIWHPRSRVRSPESRERLRSTVERLLDYSTKEKGSGDRSAKGRRQSYPSFFDDEVLAGRYRILRFIASGGVGEVYEAEDVESKQRVALKTVRREVSADPDIMERFRREVRYARRVDHPNVCRTFEIAEHTPSEGEGSTTFLTMELLEGGTLEDLLSYMKRLDPDQVLPMAEQMVAGLAAAHSAGIVHRDLKAGNVMLVRSNDPEYSVRVVLTDFGLAHGGLGESDSQEVSSLTRTGQIIGTPAYMAPEQLRGEKATEASDIYALGLLLYEMVTGARPFPGKNSFAAAVRRLEEDPAPPTDHLPALDSAWEKTILRCLARAPEDRFEAVGDILDGLVPTDNESLALSSSTAQTESSPAKVPAAKRGIDSWWMVVLAVALLIIVLMVLRF